MNVNRILCFVLGLAACCFLAGTVNHIVNTHEGWLSSLLLAGGCLCGAIVFAKKNKAPDCANRKTHLLTTLKAVSRCVLFLSFYS